MTEFTIAWHSVKRAKSHPQFYDCITRVHFRANVNPKSIFSFYIESPLQYDDSQRWVAFNLVKLSSLH